MVEIAVYALFGLSAGLASFALADSAVKWINAYRAIRKQLEEIRNVDSRNR